MKKQIKSCFAVILAVLIMFSCLSVGASALAEGDTVRVTGTNDWVQGFYYDFNGNFGTGHYGQHQWLKADGKIAYCVEPLKNLTAGNKTIKEIWASFSADQQKMVTAAYIYGYNGSSRYGYSAATEYVATQAIIWAIAFNVFNTSREDTLLNCAFSSKTSSSNRTNGKAVYAKIKQQIISHHTVPSFAINRQSLAETKKLTLKYNPSTKKYEGSLTDNNGVLSGYSFSYNGVNFTKSGNKLNISTDKILNNSIVTGERTSNTYCNSLPALVAVYCIGSDQTTAIAINRKDPVNAYFSLTTESIGQIKIVKTSEDGLIEGVKFHISGNGIEKDVVTGKDGTVIIGSLPVGDYAITEKTSDIYASQYTHIITVNPGATSTVAVKNTLKRASLFVTKTAEDGFTEGVKFHLYGTSMSGAKVDKYEITNSNGVAKFFDVLIGTYTLEEVDTAEKYIVPVNQTIELEWSVINKTQVENKLKRTSLEVTKIAEDGLTEGIKFHLYGTSLSGVDVDEYAITNSDGIATFSNILIGTYTLEEVDTAERYIVPASQTVKLEWNVISKAQFENKLKRTSLIVTKTAEDGLTEGIKFHLHGTSLSGVAVDEYATTNGDGIANFHNILMGTYTLEEVDTAERYVVPATQTVELEWNVISKAQFENKLKRTSLIVSKTAEDGLTEGIKFHLYGTSMSGVEVDEYATTNSDGIATFSNILIGTYTLEEVDTDERYIVPASQTVELKYGVISKAQVENKLKRTSLEITKIAEDGIVEGVKFRLYGTSLSGIEVDEYATTNSDGIATFSNILIGTYTLEEVDTAERYIIPESQTVKLEWNVISKAQVENKLKRTSLEVTKIAEDGIVEGVKFRLYGTSLSGIEVDEYATTNSDGIATFSNILIGTYTLEEVDTAERYIIPESQTVELKWNDTSKAKLENKLLSGSLVISKTDVSTGEALPNVGFRIYDKDKKVISEGVTDANGMCSFSDLKYGDYFYQEYTCDNAYVLDDSLYPFSIRENGVTIKAEMANKMKRGTLVILKTDDKGNALAGVEFTVTDKNGNVIAVSKTDKTGSVSFELPYGEYIWYESKALKGYKIDGSQHSIKIEENDQLIEVNVVNNPIPVIITENPKTGGINYYKYLIPIAAISAITLIITKRKKHSNDE